MNPSLSILNSIMKRQQEAVRGVRCDTRITCLLWDSVAKWIIFLLFHQLAYHPVNLMNQFRLKCNPSDQEDAEKTQEESISKQDKSNFLMYETSLFRDSGTFVISIPSWCCFEKLILISVCVSVEGTLICFRSREKCFRTQSFSKKILQSFHDEEKTLNREGKASDIL